MITDLCNDRHKEKLGCFFYLIHFKLWGLPKCTALHQNPAVSAACDFHMQSRCKGSSLLGHTVGLNPKGNLGSKEEHVLAIQK